MYLFPGEHIISNLDSRSPNLRLFSSDKVILTTHRIRYETKRMGYTQITSILLEQLGSVQITQTSNPILLGLALVAFIGGLIITLTDKMSAGPAVFVGAIVALVFGILYSITRRETLIFTASGATVRVAFRRVGKQFTQMFIDEVEMAKDARYMIGKPPVPVQVP